METCPQPRELMDLAGRPADDPRRLHLENCPRCRALVTAHEEFESPGDTSDLEGLALADAELKRRLDADLAREGRRNPRRNVWLAAAAVLAICALGLATTDLLRLRDGDLPRVGERVRGAFAWPGLTCTVSDGGLTLEWSDAPDGAAVIYLFYDADLRELGRRSAPDARLSLAADDALAGAVFCQALAVAEGDTVARSALVRTRTDGDGP